MAPTLFLIGADGPLMFATGSLADGDEKDAFATNARLLCIACAATACVMALESWMKLATAGEELDMTEPPSEAFDRQEVIVLMGESHAVRNKNTCPSFGSNNGKFFGFGESNMLVLDKIEGRFAQILPPKVATPEHRMRAQAMLKVKGVNFANPGTAVRLTPPRR